MLQTEDGKHIFDGLSEDGRIAIEYTILDNGLMLFGGVFLLLKLLQEKGLSIKLSKGEALRLYLSQEKQKS